MIMFPDTSDVLDRPLTSKYQMYPEGGATVAEIRDSGNSEAHARARGIGIERCCRSPAGEMRGHRYPAQTPDRPEGDGRLHHGDQGLVRRRRPEVARHRARAGRGHADRHPLPLPGKDGRDLRRPRPCHRPDRVRAHDGHDPEIRPHGDARQAVRSRRSRRCSTRQGSREAR